MQLPWSILAGQIVPDLWWISDLNNRYKTDQPYIFIHLFYIKLSFTYEYSYAGVLLFRRRRKMKWQEKQNIQNVPVWIQISKHVWSTLYK